MGTKGMQEHKQAHMHCHTLRHILTYLYQGRQRGCAAPYSPSISHVHASLYSARTPRPPGGNTTNTHKVPLNIDWNTAPSIICVF